MISFEVRRGYDSKRLLIEFEAIPADEFKPLWANILLSLKAELVSTEDVWQNDAYIWRYSSPMGKFFLTVSNGDLPFVMADDFEQDNDDNSVILTITESLAKSAHFSKPSTFKN